MAKKPKPPTLDELEARIAALEAHNGWDSTADAGEPEPPEPVEPPKPAEE